MYLKPTFCLAIAASRLNFRPLVVKMPSYGLHRSESATSSLMIEELQASPQLELEAAELDKELDNAEQHLARGVAMATEESDTDTVCNYYVFITVFL